MKDEEEVEAVGERRGKRVFEECFQGVIISPLRASLNGDFTRAKRAKPCQAVPSCQASLVRRVM